MSKRHQSSRRRSYGAASTRSTSGEADRRHTPGRGRAGARRLRRSRRRSTRSPSSTRARRGSASRSASRWRSTRGPAPAPPSCPSARGSSTSPTLPRRRVRGAVRARRQTNRLADHPRRRSSSRSCWRSSRSPRRSASRRPATTSSGSTAERDALLVRKQELLTDLNRLGQEPAVRKLAIDAGLTQLVGADRRRRATDGSTHRRWAGPIRAAARCSC